MTELDDILAHYGVVGMKWGIRRSRGSRSSGPTPAAVTQKRPGGPLKAKGGTKQPASEDAINAAKSHQKAKKSGVHALSNQELQSLVTRLNLESQHSRLRRRGLGETFAKELMTTLEKQSSGKKKK